VAELYNQYGTAEERIENIGVRLASSDDIRNWSYGEVLKPETINYRSYKPERDGLFCEKIFGPVRNWECNCGKYKRIRYRGVVCDRCGVEVTHSKVRRERMGHIELAVPITHIWFLKSTPSYIGQLVGLTNSKVEKVIYYENYIVIDGGDSGYDVGELINDDEYEELEEAGKKFTAKMGGTAIFELLSVIDLEELRPDLRLKLKMETSQQRKKDLQKRLTVVEYFVRSGNRPEDMVLSVLPVLPPDLRPLVPLEGGRFATSDLNDLYRRVINRNNRLKKLLDIKAPDVILRNEKRMLQEAVDTLIDNGRRGGSSVMNDGKRPLKSLSDLLKGKQGRFRQNLLGKRVDYSGRSVIVVGPTLKVYQCGLPRKMALELFKPFVIQKLEERDLAQTVKSAKKFVERESPEVWDILEEVITDHPVLLNRAPTLHRLGIQAFFPTLVEGKAIRLHPLVCSAFNADFDGDQMAVHVPLSAEAIIESRILMLSANNLLRPASGDPVMVPSQDMVLGIYYLTKTDINKKAVFKDVDGNEHFRVFSDRDELDHALADNQVELHTAIEFVVDGKRLETTPGRVIFNEIMPEFIGFQNEVMKKGVIEAIVSRIVKNCGQEEAVLFLDNVKDLGYKYATKSGTSFGIIDLVVPQKRDDLIKDAEKQVAKIRKQYQRGIITEGERYNKIIDIWTHTTNEVSSALYEALKQHKDGFNSVYMMLDAKARGSVDQIKQLAGMRGLMQKPQKKMTGGVGEIVENAITSNFKGGLSGLEYFISTHGARKGLADTALKTADAGYLTRRLVDVVQDMVVSEPDCGTIRGILISALDDGDEIIESLYDRIIGRVVLEDVCHPVSNAVIITRNTLLDEAMAKEIDDAGIDGVMCRSVLTCESEFGMCAQCYGRNLATGRIADVGEAAGIMAAQSIGEPGTQLTLRTFHIGGTASRLVTKSNEEALFDGSIKLYDVEYVEHKEGNMVLSRLGEVAVLDKDNHEQSRYQIPHGSVLHTLKDGMKVKKGTKLFEWDPYNQLILSAKDGKIEYMGIKENVTLRETFEELTGATDRVIIEDKSRKYHPHLRIVPTDGSATLNIALPVGAYLNVAEGAEVKAADTLYKIPRDSGKSSDITGGLPRVAELFEARKPKDPTIIAEIDGIVELKTRPVKDDKGHVVLDREGHELLEPEIERGNRKILIKSDDENGETVREYSIPVRKHMRVHDGDRVRIGDRLCDGAMNPHEILRVLGEQEVQKYLINEIQSVYRLQGVGIDDKHVEVIVTQMLRKVVIEDAGDTEYLRDHQVDKKILRVINEQLIEEELEPAVSRPLLLGITKASLTTESFLSAASFQETTKVLAKAAVQSKVDVLRGLKENLIMGNLIPAGTGARLLANVEVRDVDVLEEPEHEDGLYPDEFDELGGEIV
jgi:DNA-directed RNA polymerase subunit beta'